MKKDLYNRIYDLIARKISGEAAAEELQELEGLLLLHPEFKNLHDSLLQFPALDKTAIRNTTDQAYASQFVKMIYADKDARRTEIPAKKSFYKRAVYVKTAAIAAMLVIAVFTIFYFLNNKGIKPTNIVKTAVRPANTSSRMTLPDGTIVYLNANSHLEYGKGFNNINRDVVLTGEAFFDVAHNPRKPFIVHTEKAVIKVLGTKFNVKNYADELWEATLLQGKIEMYLKERPKEKLRLEPSQKVTIKTKTVLNNHKKDDYNITVTQIKPVENNIVETAWMTDKLVFEDKPLEAIAKDLERAFGIAVNFQSDAVKQYRYTGVFQNDDLEKVLKILDLSKPIQYEFKNNVLTIK
ncbi:MAG: FecR domain-containing protein [Niabella sp.]